MYWMFVPWHMHIENYEIHTHTQTHWERDTFIDFAVFLFGGIARIIWNGRKISDFTLKCLFKTIQYLITPQPEQKNDERTNSVEWAKSVCWWWVCYGRVNLGICDVSAKIFQLMSFAPLLVSFRRVVIVVVVSQILEWFIELNDTSQVPSNKFDKHLWSQSYSERIKLLYLLNVRFFIIVLLLPVWI